MHRFNLFKQNLTLINLLNVKVQNREKVEKR